MTREGAIKLPDDIIRILYYHLPLESSLALIHVNRAAYAIAVDEPRLVRNWLKELPGNQTILNLLDCRELLAVLNQRARFNLVNVHMWSNVTDLAFNRSVGGFVLNPGSAIVSSGNKTQGSNTHQNVVNLDAAIINMAHGVNGSVCAYTVIVAAGARKAFVYSIGDQAIQHSDTIFDPFPEEVEVTVSIAKIATWDTEELGISVLYCHQKGSLERWSVSHYPVSCSKNLQNAQRPFSFAREAKSLGYIMTIDKYNQWQRNYFVGRNLTTYGRQRSPLAISITAKNRCVIAWRHDSNAIHRCDDGFNPTITVTTYDPHTTIVGQHITQFGLLAYVSRDILFQGPDWKESRSLVAYALSHICDLETFEDLDLVADPPGEQVSLQIFSHRNPFDFSHGGLLCHYKIDDVFGDLDKNHPNMLPFDSSPNIFLSPLTANNERLDFSSSADYYYIGPTIAYAPLANGQNGWIQLVSRDRLWIQRVFLAGNFFFINDYEQFRLSKLLVNLLEWPGVEAVHGLNAKTILSHHHNPDNQTCRIAVADGHGVRVWSIRLAHFIETNFGTMRQPEMKGGVEDKEMEAEFNRERTKDHEDSTNDDGTDRDDGQGADSGTEEYIKRPNRSRDDVLFRDADYPDVFRYHHFESGQYDIVSLHPARFDAGGVVQQLQLTSDRLLVLTNEGVRHWYFGRHANGLRTSYVFEDDEQE